MNLLLKESSESYSCDIVLCSIIYLCSFAQQCIDGLGSMSSLLAYGVLFCNFNSLYYCIVDDRKEGQDTQDDLQKRNLREELDERERRHFSSKDKSYGKLYPTSLSSFKV